MSKIHVITFGAGGKNFKRAAQRIVRQALKFTEINSATAFVADDLDAGYFDRFPDFPTRFPRGFGLWSWKPYLIDRELSKILDDDILLYVDGGCELNHTAYRRFAEYVEHVNKYGVLLVELNNQNYRWTKNDPRLLPDDECRLGKQRIATILMIKKSTKSQRFVADWLALSSEDDGYLLKDVVSEPQHPDFVDHRHDQSTLTAVSYRYGYPALPDETFIAWNGLKNFVRSAMRQPILTLRNKNGIPFMPLIRLIDRLIP